jgi:small subunit ribosomal protein S6
LLDQLKQQIAKGGGTIEKEDNWGIRRLAYRIKKQNEGRYILLQFTASPDTAKELERRLRVSDLVLKFITVRIDEKLKKVEKRRKAREKRAARKPQIEKAAPAVPTPEQVMAEAAEAAENQ